MSAFHPFLPLWPSGSFRPIADIAATRQAVHVAQIEQRADETEDEFWARVDPYDDRFSRELPRWSCLVFVAVLLALGVAAYYLLD